MSCVHLPDFLAGNFAIGVGIGIESRSTTTGLCSTEPEVFRMHRSHFSNGDVTIAVPIGSELYILRLGVSSDYHRAYQQS
jgi:hypothetical protein